MSSLYITHYYVQGTDPWKNIMLLPEEAAFQKAAELAAAHKGMTSFGRFADFRNYYPLRKSADKRVREQFTGLGGKPRLEHPFSFVLGESDYLRKWFDGGDSLRIPLDGIPDELISFTLGDSCAKYSKNDSLDVLTKQMLIERLHATTLLVYTSYHFGLPTEPCHHVCVPSAYQSSWTFGTVRPAG